MHGSSPYYSWRSSLLIARFYEVKSGERTYFRLFLVPAFLFLAAGVRYAFASDSWVGDSTADLLLFFGGISALLLGQPCCA